MIAWLLVLTLVQAPVYVAGSGIQDPQAIRRVDPTYTPQAILARTQGSVTLEGIVELDGTLSDIHVVRALDPELDAEAVNAAQKWRFRPGMKDGSPVRVKVTLEMSFSLRTSDSPIVVLRRTEQDGSQTSFEITYQRFQQLPRWNPADAPVAPLATADAIRAATNWLQRTNRDGANLMLAAVSMRRFAVPTNNQWYYQLDFIPAVRDPNAPMNTVTAVVLFDGAVVEPKR